MELTLPLIVKPLIICCSSLFLLWKVTLNISVFSVVFFPDLAKFYTDAQPFFRCTKITNITHTLVLNKTLLTSTLAIALFIARNDLANSAVFAPNSRNYVSSCSISLPSVEELFDCITCSKLYDTLHDVILRYISSDTVIFTVYTVQH